MPWLSWFEENRNARSSKPCSRSGQRSTLVYRFSPGSAWTAAFTRFFPTPVRPAAPSARFTRSRSTGSSLVERPQVAPRLPQAAVPQADEQRAEGRDADQGSGGVGQEPRGRAEGEQREGADRSGAEPKPPAAFGQDVRREQREQRREDGDSRERQGERAAVQFEGFGRRPGQDDVQQQRSDREQRQPPVPPGYEEQRERDRDTDRRGHPRAEQDDQPADLAAGVALVGRAERRADDRLADEREDAGRGGDGREGDERGADNVARCPLVRQHRPAQGHARD